MSENWYDEATIKKQIALIVEKEVKKSLNAIPEHLAGNKYSIPPSMAEWMDDQWKKYGALNDIIFTTAVGYGPYCMQVQWLIRKDSITMTFIDPSGMRMFMLDLIK